MPTLPYVTSATDAAGVTTIEFATAAHNSLPARELSALAGAIEAAGADEACAVIVLRSGGERTFCAGASFEELIAVGTEDEGLAFFSGFARVINAMRRCPRLIVGRVQGKAVGGGVGLAAACDLVYATRFASVKLSELAIGIGPFVIGPAVERKVGTAAFAEMSLRADEWFGAAYAKTRGLYTEVVEDAAALDEAVVAKAATLAGYHREAAAELKRVLWAGTEDWDALLRERAAISGRLVTRAWTRAKLAELKS